MSCERCEDGCYFDCEYGEMEGFAFCPMCADPLTEQKPLTLEQLKERDAQPVYFVDIKNPDETGWAIWDNVPIECWSYEPSNYGITWKCYTHKPKED